MDPLHWKIPWTRAGKRTRGGLAAEHEHDGPARSEQRRDACIVLKVPGHKLDRLVRRHDERQQLSEPEPSDGALSGEEIAAFVARGFHVVDTRGDISAEFHAAFAARSREINDRPREVPLQDVGFLELEEDMAVVLRCPSVRGALSSRAAHGYGAW